MTYKDIYGFKKCLALAISFIVLWLAIIGGSLAFVIIRGVSWYLVLPIFGILYLIFSCLYLYRHLFGNFKEETKQKGEFKKTQIFYERETNQAYVKENGNHVPLVGLYQKKLWEKFPEQSKIAVFLPNDKKTAILLQKQVR